MDSFCLAKCFKYMVCLFSQAYTLILSLTTILDFYGYITTWTHVGSSHCMLAVYTNIRLVIAHQINWFSGQVMARMPRKFFAKKKKYPKKKCVKTKKMTSWNAFQSQTNWIHSDRSISIYFAFVLLWKNFEYGLGWIFPPNGLTSHTFRAKYLFFIWYFGNVSMMVAFSNRETLCATRFVF